MNPDWTLLALSALFLLMGIRACIEQGTIGKLRAFIADTRAALKVRWRLATIPSEEASMLYLLADEAWTECHESADPRIGSGLRSPVERHRYYLSRHPEAVDEAIEKLRAVGAA